MQIFYPSLGQMLFLFCVLWTLFQLGAAVLCAHLPDKSFEKDAFLYRERKFEKGGLFYQKYLRIRRWKHWLPDGAAAFGGYRKRHLTDYSAQNLEKFLVESRRAELTHWLAIPFFWIFGFFASPIIIPLMFLYALGINLPCIVAQRYNRPRIQRLLEKQGTATKPVPVILHLQEPSLSPESEVGSMYTG